MKEPIKVATYARVSTNDKKQDIDLQREALDKFIKRYQWEASHYQDFGSGKDTHNRPNWQRMMKEAREGNLEAIVVTKLDRFSRSIIDFTTNVLLLDQWGVRFIAIEQGIDTDKSNPAARLLMHVLAAFAQFERELISERVRAGVKKRIEKGLPMGPPRKIFDVEKASKLLKEGMSIRQTASKLGINYVTMLRRVKEYDQKRIGE